MKLSIAMIVKNEGKNIKRTLKPLKKLQDYVDSEIIIVDTGSTDSTVEIAKKYTDKIYFHKWNNNFADMRNICLNYCTGDWILVVDADEVLYDIKKLATFINDNKINKYNSAIIKIINFTKDIETSINVGAISPMVRIFKNKTVKYKGSIHEQPIFKEPVYDPNIRFVHYGYDNNDYRLMEYKFKRNLNLLLEELKKEPDNIYVICQIALVYNMHKDLKLALKYIEIAYDKCKNQIKEYIYVLNTYCIILNQLGEYDLLLKKSEQALKYEDFIDFYFYKGESLFSLHRYDEAIEAYNNYLKHYEELKDNKKCFNITLSAITMFLKNNVLCKISLSYYRNKLYEKALNVMLKIDDKNILREKSSIILKIIIDGNLWSRISCLCPLIDKYNYENTLLCINNQVLIEDLNIIREENLEGSLKEIISIVKYYKVNKKINEIYLEKIKNIINRDKTLYSIYLYYVLKYDINQIKFFRIYGKDKIENILCSLCVNYYDFNESLLTGLDKIKPNNIENIVIRTIMQKALLLGNKLPSDKKKDVFLDYVAYKYYSIQKYYNFKLIEENNWMLSSKDRFIIELKDALYYKLEDTLKYVKKMKDSLSVDKSYTEYIKILSSESDNKNVNDEVKKFIPELLKNINTLINDKKYQEAYDTIEQALSLVKFDFDLMVLKYNLLVQFNYEEEANKCLKDIILYGDSQKVNELIEEI